MTQIILGTQINYLLNLKILSVTDDQKDNAVSESLSAQVWRFGDQPPELKLQKKENKQGTVVSIHSPALGRWRHVDHWGLRPDSLSFSEVLVQWEPKKEENGIWGMSPLGVH